MAQDPSRMTGSAKRNHPPFVVEATPDDTDHREIPR